MPPMSNMAIRPAATSDDQLNAGPLVGTESGAICSVDAPDWAAGSVPVAATVCARSSASDFLESVVFAADAEELLAELLFTAGTAWDCGVPETRDALAGPLEAPVVLDVPDLELVLAEDVEDLLLEPDDFDDAFDLELPLLGKGVADATASLSAFVALSSSITVTSLFSAAMERRKAASSTAWASAATYLDLADDDADEACVRAASTSSAEATCSGNDRVMR